MVSERDAATPSISNAEWEVMQTLWDRGPLAARDVFAALPEGHGWANKTVKTLLARLVAKGAVAYDQVGNSYLYRAACSRDQVTRREVRRFVDRVLGGSLSQVLVHFMDSGGIDEGEIGQMRRLLDKAEAKGSKKGAKR